MNEREQKMKGFLNRAAKIIKETDAISPIPKKNIPTMSEAARMDGVSVGGDMDYSYGQQSYTQQPQEYYPSADGSFTESSKKLPKGILESIMSNPISEYNGQMGGLSVLDSFLPPPQARQQVPQPRQQMNEDFYSGEKPMPTMEDKINQLRESKSQQTFNPQQSYQPQQTFNPQQSYQPQPSGNGGIDYSLINGMIKMAIAEEFKTLKRAMLQESKQASAASGDVIIKVGNGIKFITNNGNVYEGKVKLTGNLDNIVK